MKNSHRCRKQVRRQVEHQIAAFKAYCDVYWDLLPTPTGQPFLLASDVKLFSREWFHVGCLSIKWHVHTATPRETSGHIEEMTRKATPAARLLSQ